MTHAGIKMDLAAAGEQTAEIPFRLNHLTQSRRNRYIQMESCGAEIRCNEFCSHLFDVQNNFAALNRGKTRMQTISAIKEMRARPIPIP